MTWKKVVQRTQVQGDPISDVVGLLDVIELNLGIGTGEESLGTQLSAIVADIERAGGSTSETNVESMRRIIEQLRKVEELLLS
ncbi:hypothetical protein CWB41_05175 [Methylovirgula ligni]|uniref:Uncharacterized protein n=1 Tax=Methylovirgula ligni TaxID=569860 RepID=A0A3D9Z2Z6_9HYPH|nr:hypothetical protein [Methylovirgula ligni]QAY95199.1 hypothetical protein CWB41_05175 [Methylovirgula ligni]REF89512.1 hypothetical protein DES32_0734 [Methylovirgula ligni]